MLGGVGRCIALDENESSLLSHRACCYMYFIQTNSMHFF